MNKGVFGISIAAIVIIAGIISIFLYKNMSQRPAYAEIEVKKGNIQEVLDLSGKVQPQKKADLGFEIGGKVVKLNYQVGDFVKNGTVLANVNSDTLQAQYRAAQALARSAEANVDQYRQLYEKEKNKLNSLKKSSTANSADKKAQKNQIKASQAQVNAQEEQLAASLANVEAAKAQITKTILTAPFDGVIARQDVEIGETVQANVPVITLISSNSFKVETFVSEIDVNKIQVGDAAEITLDDQPNKIFSAKITAIDPAESLVGNVSNYKVTLNFSENIENLRSGINANISVISKEKDGVLVAPQNAVFEESGKKYVYVLKNGLKLKTEVQAGILGKDNLIEIVSGLQEGDKLLVPSK